MHLSEQLASRYRRHIMIPEIGTSGQKKIIDSAVLIEGASVESVTPLLFYLVASGIGTIFLNLDNKNNLANITENLLDLNPEIEILTDERNTNNISIKVIVGDKTFVQKALNKNKCLRSNVYTPILILLQGSWCGIIQLIRVHKELDFAFELTQKYLPDPSSYLEKSFCDAGKTISSCFIGALGSIETIKSCLNIGSFLHIPLFFDLLNMRFVNEADYKPFYSDKVVENSAHIKDISGARVLVVGTGGLGSPAAYALTSLGINTIGIVDSDTVELSNLNRQILHSTSRIGIPKVKSAETFLNILNPSINIITFNTRLTSINAQNIIADFDMVISAVDNLQTRYILNDACYYAKKPLAEAGVFMFDGLNFTILPDKGPCYRCLFPQISPSGEMSSFSEAGILGPVPGVMGTIQASETFKVLSGVGKTLEHNLLLYDALEAEFRMANLNKNPNCQLCGNKF
jgi:molybdopterin/thiamine biosynthesis adenylyltransferase